MNLCSEYLNYLCVLICVCRNLFYFVVLICRMNCSGRLFLFFFFFYKALDKACLIGVGNVRNRNTWCRTFLNSNDSNVNPLGVAVTLL